MTGGGTSPSRQRLFALVGALAIVLVAIGYFLRRADTLEATPAPAQSEPAEPTEPAPTAETPPPAPRPAPAPPSPAPPKEEVVTSDGIPIMPPRGNADGAVHPHPITPRHERIYAENRLIGALDGAMDVKDAAGMRRLLQQYRREYPEDDNQLQDGYAVIADCFDHPGDAARAAARTWLTTHNGSPLKRWVNRYCLE